MSVNSSRVCMETDFLRSLNLVGKIKYCCNFYLSFLNYLEPFSKPQNCNLKPEQANIRNW